MNLATMGRFGLCMLPPSAIPSRIGIRGDVVAQAESEVMANQRALAQERAPGALVGQILDSFRAQFNDPAPLTPHSEDL